MTTWRYAAATDVGLVREVNEDSIHVDNTIAIVADGMGGHAAGEVASALAVEVIEDQFRRDPTEDGLLQAIRIANQRIIDDAAANPAREGMGTTAVMCALVAAGEGRAAVVVNVGDSRAYQLRDGALRRVTTDHSVAEEWLRQGRLTAEEAEIHPRRHQLTRTLGFDPGVQPDVFRLDVQAGDRLLLCSDGLSNELTDSDIAQLAGESDTLEASVAALIEGANRHGGRDNISAILLHFDEVSVLPAMLEFASAAAVTAAAAPVTNAPTAAPEPPTSRVAQRQAAKKRRRFSWRAVAFVLALFGFIAAAFFVIGWYANSSYYLAEDQGVVAIYQGQPNGVLWFHPHKVLDTYYKVSDLSPYDQANLKNPTTVGSLDAAIAEANALYNKVHPTVPGSTTTTTSVTSTTTGSG